MTQPSGAAGAMVAWAQARAWRGFTDDSGAVWRFHDGGARGGLPALVLLPGALGDAASAWRLAEAFEAERRVIAVTYPGGMAPDALADGLSQLLAMLDAGACAVWGSSYGAWWAQAFARRHPHQVGALWLGNTFVDAGDLAGAALFDAQWLGQACAAEVQARWQQALAARPDDELRAVQLRLLRHALSPEQFRGRLLQVADAPMLPPAQVARMVVCDCADDPIIAPAARARVRARYPHADHVGLDSGGHYPHVVTPDALVQAMRPWLAIH